MAYKLNQKVNKPYLNKTIRGFTGNKEPGKNTRYIKVICLLLQKILLFQGAFSITIWGPRMIIMVNPGRWCTRSRCKYCTFIGADKES